MYCPCLSHAQVSTIEFSLVEVSVLHGLQQGNEVLKEIHKEMNLETVEKIMEETAEAREYQRVHNSVDDVSMFAHGLQEIDEMLASNLTVEDEEAVQVELLALQREAVSSTHRTLWHRVTFGPAAVGRRVREASQPAFCTRHRACRQGTSSSRGGSRAYPGTRTCPHTCLSIELVGLYVHIID